MPSLPPHGSRRRPERGAIERGRLTRDVLQTIRLLARGRHLVEDIAAELGRGRRTAYRILSALGHVGLVVEHQREGACVYLRLSRAEVEDWLYTRPISPRRAP